VVPDTASLTAVALDGLEQAEAIDRADETAQRGSRSHKLLIVSVLRRTTGGDLFNSKLLFCDLAGVERPDKATKGASKPFGGKTPEERKAAMAKKGDAKREDPTAKAIIRVCDSLFDFRNGHIPYRDSKLTRLLKCALGGEGRGVFVGCVSSGAARFAETEAVLAFLHKVATGVFTKPTPFVLNAAAEVARREAQVVPLALSLKGLDAAAALALKASEVECTMESPPEMAELRDLIAQIEFLKADPMAALRAEQAP